MPIDVVKDACKKYGLHLSEPATGTEYIWLYKPNVLNHPVTQLPALTGNLGVEIKNLGLELDRMLSKDHTSWLWMLHRFVWRHDNVFGAIARVKRIAISLLRGNLPERGTKTGAPIADIGRSPPKRMGGAVREEDKKNIAGSIMRHLDLVKWQKGDILVIDNLRMAHLGMPGVGPRALRALLCNTIKIDLSIESPGRQTDRRPPTLRITHHWQSTCARKHGNSPDQTRRGTPVIFNVLFRRSQPLINRRPKTTD